MLIRSALIFLLLAPPVYGAYLVSAYWYWPLGGVVGVFALLGLYRHGSRRNRLLLCGATSAIFLLNGLLVISVYFQGTGFNGRYFFHFSVSTLGVAIEQFPALVFGGGVLWLLSSVLPWGLAPLQLAGRRRFYGAALVGVATFAPLLSLGGYVIDEYRLGPRLSLPTASAPQPIAVDETFTPRKNLILIYAESVEQLYFDDTIFGDVTPHLRRLRNEGLAFTNVHEVRNTGSTIGGIIASQCSLPTFNNTTLGSIDNPYPNIHCLMDILSAYDYETVYLGGARLEFAGKGTFLESHGYQKVLGRDAVVDMLPDREYLSRWGVYDDSLLQIADRELERLLAQDHPFALTLLTLDTHHPDGHPSRSCHPTADREYAILDAVACSDELLGEFIASIRADPRHENTVVFVMSDHLAMRNGVWETFLEHWNARRLLAFALGDDIPAQQHRNPATHFDLGPTILDLLDIPGYRHNNWGQSLLGDATGYWFEHQVSPTTEAESHLLGRDPVWRGVATVHPEGPTIAVDGRRFTASVSGTRLNRGSLYALVFDRNGDFIHAVGGGDIERFLEQARGRKIIAVSRNEHFNAGFVNDLLTDEYTWFIGELAHSQQAQKGLLESAIEVDLDALPTYR